MTKWSLVLLLVPLSGQAQQVHKCKLADGSTVYQSEACASGLPEKTWDARPYQVSPQRQAQINRERRIAETRAAVQRPRSRPTHVDFPRGPTAEQNRHARCEAAKRTRDRELEKLGLRRTHAHLRRWGDYVYEQCKP